jgi:hypothetical protein
VGVADRELDARPRIELDEDPHAWIGVVGSVSLFTPLSDYSEW